MKTRAGGYQSPADGITFYIRPTANKRMRMSPSSSCDDDACGWSNQGACSSLPETSFEDLPDDILMLIMVHLSKRASHSADLVNAMLTCRRLCGLATQDEVLQHASASALSVSPKDWSDGAHRFLRKCAQAGNMEAAYRLGMIKFYCLEDRRGGAHLMAKAAMAGHADALHCLAVIHFNGSGGARTDRDLASGVILCAKAAAQGHVEALRELGHCLQDGYGLPRNVAEGRRLLVEANAREAVQRVCPGPLPPPRLHPEPPKWASGVGSAVSRVSQAAGQKVPIVEREAPAASWAAFGGGHPDAATAAMHASQAARAREAYVRTVSGPLACVPQLAKAGETSLASASTSTEVGSSGAGPSGSGEMVEVPIVDALPGRWLGTPVPVVPSDGAGGRRGVMHSLPVQALKELSRRRIVAPASELQPGGVERQQELQNVVPSGGFMYRSVEQPIEQRSATKRQFSEVEPVTEQPNHRPFEKNVSVLPKDKQSTPAQPTGPSERSPLPKACCVWAPLAVPCRCQLESLRPTPQMFILEWYQNKILGEGLHQCGNARCGRPETRKQEFRCCSACSRAKYCSRACQAHDWKAGHKTVCPLAALNIDAAIQLQLPAP